MHRFLVVALCATVAVAAIFVTTLILLPVALPDFFGCAIREIQEQVPIARGLADPPTIGEVLDADADRKVQVLFTEPAEAVVEIEPIAPGEYRPGAMTVPFRYNFCYDSTIRLTISQPRGKPSLELLAVLTISPASPQSQPYLEKMSIPLAVDQEDVDTVRRGDSITKAIYLPQFQNTGTGECPETVTCQGTVSREGLRNEAEGRGTLLAVLEISLRGKSAWADKSCPR